MAATEQNILTTFLLTPSSLTTIFTFQSFQALLPSAQRSSPEVKRLYRALQHRRALVTDVVAQNIDDEVERGNSQRRAVVRARRAAERQEPDEEVAVENAVCMPLLLRRTSLTHFERSSSDLPRISHLPNNIRCHL
jgi:centromere-localized protein 2